MSKRDSLSDQLKTRVAHGYYALKPLPSERQLAAECGVSYMTARRAVQQLIDEGLVARSANGRLEINRTQDTDQQFLSIALLRPSARPHNPDVYGVSLERAMSARRGSVRSVEFVHWDDPLIADVLKAFDGVFVIPSSDLIPPLVLQRLRESDRPLAVLGMDLSHVGIPSITHIPAVFAQRLLDHLEAVGCRRIACLNTQPHDSIVQERIDQWRVWVVVHRHAEILINQPTESYTSAFQQAHTHIKALLEAGEFDADALLCTTTPAAMGAMRALHEAGIKPGVEVAVCAIDGEGIAPYFIPSLTAVEEPDPTQYIAYCLEWMASGGQAWKGPLHMQPAEVPIVYRESTTLFQGNRS